jgi:ATP-dependent DNA helicase RecQ
MQRKEDSGIIYCLSRKSTESLAAEFKRRRFAAEAYHAGLNQRGKSPQSGSLFKG